MMDIIVSEDTIVLREDEIICPVCKGVGHTKKSIYVCEKCDGSGKVDDIFVCVMSIVKQYENH